MSFEWPPRDCREFTKAMADTIVTISNFTSLNEKTKNTFALLEITFTAIRV
jgi:hypothetical protein